MAGGSPEYCSTIGSRCRRPLKSEMRLPVLARLMQDAREPPSISSSCCCRRPGLLSTWELGVALSPAHLSPVREPQYLGASVCLSGGAAVSPSKTTLEIVSATLAFPRQRREGRERLKERGHHTNCSRRSCYPLSRYRTGDRQGKIYGERAENKAHPVFRASLTRISTRSFLATSPNSWRVLPSPGASSGPRLPPAHFLRTMPLLHLDSAPRVSRSCHKESFSTRG